MQVTLDTTGANDPKKREVRLIFSDEHFRVGVVMKPTFAHMLGANLILAATEISDTEERDYTFGKVYLSSFEVSHPEK